LMERVVTRENMEAAIKSVKRNKGAAGIDGMTVFEIEEHINEYYIPLRNKLLNGTYKPQPVKRVEIPKPNGEKRKLGIPCVRD
ncbi:group II intron reverse transcriptase/maturase, partial [Ruoffia sp. FAM 26255]